MKKLVVLAVLSVNLLGLCLCCKVYYVKPAGPSSPECPSDSLPCHSLQYYVNHSNFTNNSLFRFLPGEHHLDSVVDISKVANLSLEGVGPGVRILCNSLPSGFNIREFVGLNLKKITMLNCLHSDLHSNISVNLELGSELSIDDVTVSGGYEAAIGLQVTSVTGSLNISNSFFPAFQGGSIVVNFMHCNQPSFLNFSNNKVKSTSDFDRGLLVDIHCPNVYMLLANTVFDGAKIDEYSQYDISFQFCKLINISLLISNSTFNNSLMLAQRNDDCETKDDYCSHNNFMTFKQITFISSNVEIISQMPTESCAIAIEDSVVHFGSLTFAYFGNNTDTFIQAKFSNVTFLEVTSLFSNITVLFVNCSFMNNKESAISAWFSILFFQGYNLIKNNSASIGAGLSLVSSSYLFLQPHTYVLFENNHADYLGGAIFIDSQPGDPCFYSVVVDSSPLNETIEVDFINNSAGLGGSSLYGNNILQCNSLHNFFSNISNTESTPSAVASDPYKVCFCEENRNLPNCPSFWSESKTVRIFPGENFILHLAIVGSIVISDYGPVTGVVRAYFDSSSKATLGPLQGSQLIHKPRCQNITYTIYSTDGADTQFMLTTELGFIFNLISADPELTVNVFLWECPIGFVLSNSTGKCDCDDILLKNGIVCDIDSQSISRLASTWIGLSDINLLFHPHCPIGYCLPYNTSITSNTSDSQCAPHRTGLLCGKCEEGYSLTLGNGTCATCSNTYLLLILPLAVSGLLLVAILFALNLTVTEGTINGLIFYANVLGMNRSTLYSGEANWLYAFLAWLNLDLGISTCFYDGMDGYAETWLQFVFPVYLWTIIVVIIKLYSRFPTLANRLGGGNAVKVLATLLVLLYTKLQRTVVSIMSFTTLEYPDGSVRYVWLYDANVDYFKGKHLYLGFAGIFALVFLILPYTLCLVFFQQLQACSNRFPFRWVNKFKPLFDSYAGPYKDRYRFWTGMLLLVRTLLIVLFTATSASGLAEYNLLIILIVSLALSLASSNGVYKKCPLNYLEVFFYLQLGVFAGGIMYAIIAPRDVTIVADTSIGLSLAVFVIVIIGYHSILILKALKGYYYRLIGYAGITEENDALLSFVTRDH